MKNDPIGVQGGVYDGEVVAVPSTAPFAAADVQYSKMYYAHEDGDDVEVREEDDIQDDRKSDFHHIPGLRMKRRKKLLQR